MMRMFERSRFLICVVGLMMIVYVNASESKGDHVGMSKESVMLRKEMLKKKKGMFWFLKRKSSSDFTSDLFPGSEPVDYELKTAVPMFSELVQSKKTQMPYHYYKLPIVCPRPDVQTKKTKKNLGQRLTGQSTDLLPFEINTLVNVKCKSVCNRSLDGEDLLWVRKLVKNKYRHFFTLDSLPVLMRSNELNFAVRGFPLGFQTPPSPANKLGEFYLFNHLSFIISYHQEDDASNKVRITGFDVHPVSIVHTESTCNNDASSQKLINKSDTYLALKTGEAGEPLKVTFSYGVQWRKSTLSWSDRWDVYLIGSPNENVQYVNIMNSVLLLLLLTGAVATIMLRIIRRDIMTYNDLEETKEEFGWKLLHADVFRAPHARTLLSVAVGTGIQIGSCIFLTILCGILKIFNPMRKGQTLSVIIILYVLNGSVGGYVSARLYKHFKGTAWKRNTLLMATAFPGIMVSMFLLLNIFLGFQGAATSVSTLTILAVFLLWVCVSTPLVFIGSYFGFVAERIEAPIKPNEIVRFIPEPHKYVLYHKFYVTYMLAGLCPFLSIYVEAYLILGALWLHQMFYVFGFVVCVMIILTGMCALVSIVLCYFQLCAEDHKWWWKSFMYGTSVGVYLFVYSLWFLISRLKLVGFLPVMVYVTYMGIISLALALYCGSIGAISSFLFCCKIYSAIKRD